ncbi:glutamine amidotransferase [Rugosibacter aromaticivorans]|uniref:Glutamine amidotransferase n=1 Tax=Rugosibacter aromaticivorans TaxID=1565605 RepID=A0A0C5JN11_9PROT|nr:type 1 glutamine amidotransferase [Rugosibacter aromaticivorans]AJP48766.1 glutamine amidotransferase [Rugosibacter aromaticivorans]TBR13529.1 MAG: type 1 glutamine amidotransferase [Rugosibacter sp.]
MKPIAIFRHSPSEGAGYFATFLERHSLPWTLFTIDAGVLPPPTSDDFSGLCFMGGPMSVNDDLPWIAPALSLIRDADSKGVPVIGHCLGGQLMSKAFGGMVTKNAVKEIGWGQVEFISALAAEWVGDIAADFAKFDAFHWHGETFSLPPHATRILQSEYCENQAFVRGLHLGMQCHVEMTESMIRLWGKHWDDEGVAASASVQTPQQMYTNMADRIERMRQVADRLYSHWIRGLKSA